MWNFVCLSEKRSFDNVVNLTYFIDNIKPQIIYLLRNMNVLPSYLYTKKTPKINLCVQKEGNPLSANLKNTCFRGGVTHLSKEGNSVYKLGKAENMRRL